MKQKMTGKSELKGTTEALLLVDHLHQALLMEDQDRRIILVNQHFCDLFSIPVSPDQLLGSDCSQSAEQVKGFFQHPDGFVSRINEILQAREKCLGETVRMANGKVLVRDYIPIYKDGIFKGTLWTYSDVTKHSHIEDMELQLTINYFLSSLYNKDTVEDILWDVARNCISRLGFTDCIIYLFDDDGMLVQKAAWGAKVTGDFQILKPIRIAPGSGIVGTVAATGVAEIIADTSLDQRYIVDDEFRFSEISVPILNDGEVLGVIDSEHPEKNFFNEKHLSILKAIASLCAIKMVQIEERRKQQKEMDQQKDFYEDILNNLPADIAVFDNSHHYLFVNPTAVRDPKLRQWLIGRKDEDYCDYRGKPYDIIKERRNYFNKALETRKEIGWEEAMTGPDGKESWHMRKFYPVIGENGYPDLVIGYALNITERHQAESRIAQSEKKYRDLFNFSPALIFTHNMQFEIISANPAMNNLLGFEEGAMIGKRLSHLLPAGETDPYYEAYVMNICENETVRGLVPVLNPAGKLLHLLCHAYKVSLNNDETYVIVYGQDISERVAMEEDLQRAKLESEQNAAAKQSFLAKVSHEIRTPMNGIIGMADLLMKTDPDEQQLHYISVLKSSARNLLAIVNDVLDVEKILAGKMLLEETSFNLQHNMALLTEIYQGPAVERLNRLEVRNTLEGSGEFKGDPFRLSQVLGNLISNAIKFTYGGTIGVNISAVGETPENIMVQFDVSDTGVGIPSDQLEKIFEPFTQFYQDLTPRRTGTGLGLTICKEIAGLMGGSLSVSSEPGKGSVFSFRVPLKKFSAASVSSESPVGYNDQALRGKKILFAEDMELNQFIVKQMLGDLGVDLHIACNGLEAVEKSLQQSFDLVLMDIQMPLMNGIDAVKVIRNDPDNPNCHTPVIAVSANAFESDKKNYVQAGMNAALSKPFDSQQLIQVMVSVLDNQGKEQFIANAVSHGNTGDGKIDISYLNQVGGGRPEFVAMMLQSFADSVENIINGFQKALLEMDWVQIGELAHQLKFALRVIGVTALEKEILWLEKIRVSPGDYSASDIRGRVEVLNSALRVLQQEALERNGHKKGPS